MGSKEKEKSLLEIAIELLDAKKKPQKMLSIVKEVMEIKGLKVALAKELAPQFILDFMQSGYFVYCGDDTWDLKDRQPTSVLDKEGGEYDDIYEDDEEVKSYELKDDMFDEDESKVEDEDDEEDDDDDLAKAFESFDEVEQESTKQKRSKIVDSFEKEDIDDLTDMDDELADAYESLDEEFGGGMVIVSEDDNDDEEE